MSRSNSTESARNPSTRWFEWYGASTGGYARYYDKDTKANKHADKPFRFLLLDELSTVKGWHQASESGIFANEVRDTRQDTLIVKAFKGGELAAGIYANIRDRIGAMGGYFQTSAYIAFKDGDTLKIGNFGLNGAALQAWMEFKKNCPTKKNASGKTVKGFYVDAVSIDGFTEGKKGSIVYRVPQFKLAEVSAETNAQAVALDAELQEFFKDYLGRTRTEQTQVSKAAAPAHAEQEATPAHHEAPVAAGDFDDDIPF